MAKLEIGTDSTEVHTKATQLNVPHTHERRHYYTNSHAWFDLVVDDQAAIAKGYQINVSDYVHIGNDTDEDNAKMLMDANFDPLVFLDKRKAWIEVKNADAEQYRLKREREEEEAQRLSWRLRKPASCSPTN